MTQYNRPNETVFASGAKPGELENFPDIARGWGIAFDQADGIPPMEWFNALFKRNDEAVRYLLQKGISEWSPTEDYPIGAHVQESDKVWKAKVSSSGKRPSQTPSDWVETALNRDALVTLIQEQLGGIGVKVRVRAASTANLNLNGLQTIDGINVLDGDRVLVKNQNLEAANGIYVVSSTAWVRASDADSSNKVQPGMLIHIESGNSQLNSLWQLATDGPIVLGSTGLAFEMVAGYTGVDPGTYRSLTVDRYGRITAGNNPGTLADYGISTATQAEAEAGSDNFKPMTPLRVAQAIYVRLVQATESVLGIAKIATQAQTNAGTDDATTVTPKKLRAGFSASLGVNGYISFPSWLGGVIFQWGYYSGSLDDLTALITFPIPFPNLNMNVSVTADGGQSGAGYYVTAGAQKVSTAQFRLNGYGTNMPSIGYHWFAIGY